ncbi:sugar kinase [Sphingomonas koreensis]|nr:sugar kinase [Sphingomonas koreensis]
MADGRSRTGTILSIGEVLLRLSPPGPTWLFQEPRLDAHFGGAETNVAVALARLGSPSALFSCVPDDMIGGAAIEAVRRHGVDTSRVLRAPGRLGLYYLAAGAGPRAASVTYDRAASAFAKLSPSTPDWPALFDGIGWLHLSGITPALGPDSAALALDAARAARAAGITVSFDGNYRERLWGSWPADPRAILCEIIGEVDFLFGNHRDIGLLLGEPFSDDGDERRRHAALVAFEAFGNLRWIASTARHIDANGGHELSARIDTRERAWQTPEIAITGIVDRIGTGDAFAAGVLHGLAQGEDVAVEYGLALSVLKHFIPGDFSLTGPDELAVFLAGSRDVRR